MWGDCWCRRHVRIVCVVCVVCGASRVCARCAACTSCMGCAGSAGLAGCTDARVRRGWIRNGVHTRALWVFWIDNQWGGITTRSRFLSHTVAGQNPGTSLIFFPPGKKHTVQIDQWKPWYFDAHFFLCFPTGQFALKMSCLDSKPRAIAPWSPRLVYYRSFLTLQSGGRSQVDCTIIQIELKTSKQIFRCRPGCIEQGILLCQLGWQRKTWNEMDTNGGFLWRQSFHVFFWLVKCWLDMSCFECFMLFLKRQIWNFPFNIKAHEIWRVMVVHRKPPCPGLHFHSISVQHAAS